jgi:hypothetical protein
MSTEGGLGPCDCFTVLGTSKNENVRECEVCDHLASEHASAGKRVMSGGEVEALRRRILIERYEQRQQERPRKSDPVTEVRPNGDPEGY